MDSKISIKLRTKIILIGLLLLLNIAIRYPVLPYEIGADTFYLHQLSNAITRQGGALWLGHPLMLFGINEYPLAVPVLISGMSQAFNIESEIVIYIFALIIGLLGTLAVYMLIEYATGDFLIAYFTAFFFSITPEFLRLTIWTAATRGVFIAFLPIFLYFLFKITNENGKKRYWILISFIILILLKATHNLFFFLPFSILALVIAMIIRKYEISVNIKNNKLNMMIPWFFIVLFIFSIVIFRIGIFSKSSFWYTYQSGFLLKGSQIYITFLNMIIDYVSKVGILLPVALLSVIYIFKKKLSLFEMYVLVLILLFSPIFTVGIYAPPFLLMIFAYLFSIFVVQIRNFNFRAFRKPNFSLLLIGVLIISQLIASGFMMYHWGIWSEKDVPYVNLEKNTGEFLRDYSSNGTFTGNIRGGSIMRYSIYSNIPSAPGGEYDFPSQNKSDYRLKINFDISSIMGSPESMIYLERVKTGSNDSEPSNTWYEFPALWSGGLQGGNELIKKYNIKYVLNTDFGFDPYVKTMKLFKELETEKSKIYDNSIDKVWNIE